MEDASENEYSYIVSERDFVSLLIDLYRNRPALWKVKHVDYLNKIVRAKVIDEIVKELKVYKPDFNADKVKKKINILRTNFNKEKHRVEKWRAEGRPDAKPGLWYYNELLFLNDQDCSKDFKFQTSSIASDGVDAGDESFDEKYILAEPEETANEEEEAAPEQTPKRPRFYKNISVKRRKTEPESGFTESQEESSSPEQYMTVTTTYYKKPERREDVLSKIWAMKLKKMAPQQRLYAEKIINDVLFEGEMGNLTKNGVSFCPSF